MPTMDPGSCSKRRISAILIAFVVFLVILLSPVLSAPFPYGKLRSPREKGCYYLLKHYQNGEQIETNEPCLNCSCVNSMLMCYLRVCPYVRPIGERCIIEKIPGECCPKITCPDVTPVPEPEPETHAPTTTETPETGPGCYLEGEHYREGALIPSDPSKPCEICYCIRNTSACVMQECALQVGGCSPMYKQGSCCPTRYNCSMEAATTVPPEFRHPLDSDVGCTANGRHFIDGEAVPSKNPCEHCYCMKHEIVCAVQECKPPCEGCVPIPTENYHCCPERYECVAPTRTVPSTNVHSSNESSSLQPTTEIPSSLATETTPRTTQSLSTETSRPRETLGVEDTVSTAKEVLTTEVPPLASASVSSVTLQTNPALREEYSSPTTKDQSMVQEITTIRSDLVGMTTELKQIVTSSTPVYDITTRGSDRQGSTQASLFEETTETENATTKSDKKHFVTSSTEAYDQTTIASVKKEMDLSSTQTYDQTTVGSDKKANDTSFADTYDQTTKLSGKKEMDGSSTASYDQTTIGIEMKVTDDSTQVPDSKTTENEEKVTSTPSKESSSSPSIHPTTSDEANSELPSTTSAPSSSSTHPQRIGSEGTTEDLRPTTGTPLVDTTARSHKVTTSSTLESHTTVEIEDRAADVTTEPSEKPTSTSRVSVPSSRPTELEPVSTEATTSPQVSPKVDQPSQPRKEVEPLEPTSNGTGLPFTQTTVTRPDHRFTPTSVTPAPRVDDKPSRKPTSRRPLPAVGVIPGEGICRHEGKVYQNGDEVVTRDPCMEFCICMNSLVYCDEIICDTDMHDTSGGNCTKVKLENECCPQYQCQNQPQEVAPALNQTATSTTPSSFTTTVTEKVTTIAPKDDGIKHVTESVAEIGSTSSTTEDKQSPGPFKPTTVQPVKDVPSTELLSTTTQEPDKGSEITNVTETSSVKVTATERITVTTPLPIVTSQDIPVTDVSRSEAETSTTSKQSTSSSTHPTTSEEIYSEPSTTSSSASSSSSTSFPDDDKPEVATTTVFPESRRETSRRPEQTSSSTSTSITDEDKIEETMSTVMTELGKETTTRQPASSSSTSTTSVSDEVKVEESVTTALPESRLQTTTRQQASSTTFPGDDKPEEFMSTVAPETSRETTVKPASSSPSTSSSIIKDGKTREPLSTVLPEEKQETPRKPASTSTSTSSSTSIEDETKTDGIMSTVETELRQETTIKPASTLSPTGTHSTPDASGTSPPPATRQETTASIAVTTAVNQEIKLTTEKEASSSVTRLVTERPTSPVEPLTRESQMTTSAQPHDVVYSTTETPCETEPTKLFEATSAQPQETKATTEATRSSTAAAMSTRPDHRETSSTQEPVGTEAATTPGPSRDGAVSLEEKLGTSTTPLVTSIKSDMDRVSTTIEPETARVSTTAPEKLTTVPTQEEPEEVVTDTVTESTEDRKSTGKVEPTTVQPDKDVPVTERLPTSSQPSETSSASPITGLPSVKDVTTEAYKEKDDKLITTSTPDQTSDRTPGSDDHVSVSSTESTSSPDVTTVVGSEYLRMSTEEPSEEIKSEPSTTSSSASSSTSAPSSPSAHPTTAGREGTSEDLKSTPGSTFSSSSSTSFPDDDKPEVATTTVFPESRKETSRRPELTSSSISTSTTDEDKIEETMSTVMTELGKETTTRQPASSSSTSTTSVSDEVKVEESVTTALPESSLQTTTRQQASSTTLPGDDKPEEFMSTVAPETSRETTIKPASTPSSSSPSTSSSIIEEGKTGEPLSTVLPEEKQETTRKPASTSTSTSSSTSIEDETKLDDIMSTARPETTSESSFTSSIFEAVTEALASTFASISKATTIGREPESTSQKVTGLPEDKLATTPTAGAFEETTRVTPKVTTERPTSASLSPEKTTPFSGEDETNAIKSATEFSHKPTVVVDVESSTTSLPSETIKSSTQASKEGEMVADDRNETQEPDQSWTQASIETVSVTTSKRPEDDNVIDLTEEDKLTIMPLMSSTRQPVRFTQVTGALGTSTSAAPVSEKEEVTTMASETEVTKDGVDAASSSSPTTEISASSPAYSSTAQPVDAVTEPKSATESSAVKVTVTDRMRVTTALPSEVDEDVAEATTSAAPVEKDTDGEPREATSREPVSSSISKPTTVIRTEDISSTTEPTPRQELRPETTTPRVETRPPTTRVTSTSTATPEVITSEPEQTFEQEIDQTTTDSFDETTVVTLTSSIRVTTDVPKSEFSSTESFGTSSPDDVQRTEKTQSSTEMSRKPGRIVDEVTTPCEEYLTTEASKSTKSEVKTELPLRPGQQEASSTQETEPATTPGPSKEQLSTSTTPSETSSIKLDMNRVSTTIKPEKAKVSTTAPEKLTTATPEVITSEPTREEPEEVVTDTVTESTEDRKSTGKVEPTTVQPDKDVPVTERLPTSSQPSETSSASPITGLPSVKDVTTEAYKEKDDKLITTSTPDQTSDRTPGSDDHVSVSSTESTSSPDVTTVVGSEYLRMSTEEPSEEIKSEPSTTSSSASSSTSAPSSPSAHPTTAGREGTTEELKSTPGSTFSSSSTSFPNDDKPEVATTTVFPESRQETSRRPELTSSSTSTSITDEDKIEETMSTVMTELGKETTTRQPASSSSTSTTSVSDEVKVEESVTTALPKSRLQTTTRQQASSTTLPGDDKPEELMSTVAPETSRETTIEPASTPSSSSPSTSSSIIEEGKTGEPLSTVLPEEKQEATRKSTSTSTSTSSSMTLGDGTKTEGIMSTVEPELRQETTRIQFKSTSPRAADVTTTATVEEATAVSHVTATNATTERPHEEASSESSVTEKATTSWSDDVSKTERPQSSTELSRKPGRIVDDVTTSATPPVTLSTDRNEFMSTTPQALNETRDEGQPDVPIKSDQEDESSTPTAPELAATTKVTSTARPDVQNATDISPADMLTTILSSTSKPAITFIPLDLTATTLGLDKTTMASITEKLTTMSPERDVSRFVTESIAEIMSSTASIEGRETTRQSQSITGQPVKDTTATESPSTSSLQPEPETELEEGACIFDGKAYQSAEQIPRPHPCDFCFCFRGDIICLQQTCPPPIARCYETPISGFCCPRYECPVQVTSVNVTTPRSVASSTPSSETSEVKGCEINGDFYSVGQTVKPASGPCLECKCDESGVMQCNPKSCAPQPPLLLRMNREYFSTSRRR